MGVITAARPPGVAKVEQIVYRQRINGVVEVSEWSTHGNVLRGR